MILDYSVYPDLDVLPDTLETDGDKADYVMRICGAWAFGIDPTPETFELFAGWRPIFDRFPIDSPAYIRFREHFGWGAAAPATPVG